MLRWKFVEDFSYNFIIQLTPEKKYFWYDVDFKIKKKNGVIIHHDVFFIQDGDFEELKYYLQREKKQTNITPKYYFDNFFKLKYAGYNFNNKPEYTIIKKEDINYKSLKRTIKHLKSGVSVKDIEKELLRGKHLTMDYRRSWREDVGVIAYSKLLDHAVWLNSPY